MTEGIGEIMSGALIETQVRKARDEGIKQGEIKGEKKGEKKGQRKAEVLLTTLLKQLDPASEDFQTALNGTSEDRERLYTQYKIVYEEVGEEEKKDDTVEGKKD